MYQLGTTPLMKAAMNGQLPVVEYLVERGADIEAKDNVSGVIISYETTHTSHMNISVEYVSMESLH